MLEYNLQMIPYKSDEGKPFWSRKFVEGIKTEPNWGVYTGHGVIRHLKVTKCLNFPRWKYLGNYWMKKKKKEK